MISNIQIIWIAIHIFIILHLMPTKESESLCIYLWSTEDLRICSIQSYYFTNQRVTILPIILIASEFVNGIRLLFDLLT